MNEKIFPDKFRVNNKIAVVTGGAGLIGRHVSIGLAQAGAKVYIADIDSDSSKKIIDEYPDLEIEYISLDITSEESINTCIQRIYSKQGKIDVWVNCAYPRTSDWSDKIEDIKYVSWKKNVDMHLNGYFLSCRNIAEKMKTQGNGTIINFSSIYGLVGPDFSIYDKNQTMPAAYSAIKGGIITFTRYLSTYYGRYGIRVNAVSPGGIIDKQSEDFIKRYNDKTPLGRMGKAEEIAGPVVFLASDAASYVTGHILVVDGGWTAW